MISMTSSIILATANAPMAKYFESQGFDSLYLDQNSVAAQLLGPNTDEALSLPEYAQYLKCMRTTTDVKLLAEAAPTFTDATSIANTAATLADNGADTIIINDFDAEGHPYTTLNFNKLLKQVSKRLAGTDIELMINLSGFETYGLKGIQERIKIARTANIDAITLSQLNIKALTAVAPLLAKSTDIGLCIDNNQLNFGTAQSLEPAFILDTYHPMIASNQWIQKTGESVITRIYMGN